MAKKELFIYGLSYELSCRYCDEPDSIAHTFADSVSLKFFSAELYRGLMTNIAVPSVCTICIQRSHRHTVHGGVALTMAEIDYLNPIQTPE